MSASFRHIAPIALSAALAMSSALAGPRIAVPHGGGGAPRSFGHTVPHAGGGVPRGGHAVPHSGGGTGMGHASAQRGMPPPHGQVPGHGTANGIARYGYYHGGYYPYYGYGYPYYGYPYYGYWGWPYWGFGFYGSWGYPYYGYGYYPPSDAGYGMGDAHPQTPAVIETKVSPGSAEVLLDGESVGFAKDYNGHWDELRVSPGKHTVSFQNGGYKTLTFDIDVMPGGHYVLDNDMSEGSGEERRTIAAPQAPQRQAEGPDPGYAPNGQPGGYAAPNGPPSSAPPTFQESMTVAGGRMTIHAKPDDAAVYLDGEYLGTAGELARLHGAIPVATGPHQLQIVRPGFSSDARTVEVGGPDVTRVDVTLAKQ
ncbi:MAG TPA: PEGA domain-containing protein [Candidatus Polarisedimenticolaceae bacterium]|nr:PEGA domain-containing protein [Candidatus Polarisedimenticolaceae bacterium]